MAAEADRATVSPGTWVDMRRLGLFARARAHSTRLHRPLVCLAPQTPRPRPLGSRPSAGRGNARGPVRRAAPRHRGGTWARTYELQPRRLRPDAGLARHEGQPRNHHCAARRVTALQPAPRQRWQNHISRVRAPVNVRSAKVAWPPRATAAGPSRARLIQKMGKGLRPITGLSKIHGSSHDEGARADAFPVPKRRIASCCCR
jgi:hypothetical protein